MNSNAHHVLIYENVPLPEIDTVDVFFPAVTVSVNRLDWKVREGHFSEINQYQFPLTPGRDTSRIAHATGVFATRFKTVFDYLRFEINSNSANSESTIVRELA